MIGTVVLRTIVAMAAAGGVTGAVQSAGVSGRVTNVEGNPLSDVRVMSLPWAGSKTDRNGRFVLEKPAHLIRFSKSGYRPFTAAPSRERVDIVLEASTQSVWSPPPCSPARVRRFGDTMMFTAPRGIRLYTTADVDYRTVAIRFRNVTLEFGTGVHWTYGLPLLDVFNAMVQVQERDVLTPWGDPAAEYRGVRGDGTHWRAVYSFGQSISYDHADATAAKYFDGIVDSLCFNWSKGAA